MTTDYQITETLSQRQMEAWEDAYYEATNGRLFTDASANIKACIKAGILQGMRVEDVGDMDPRRALTLSRQLSETLAEYLKPLDPN